MKIKNSLSEIKAALFNIEKTLHVKQEDLKAIIDELRQWTAFKDNLDYGIKLHQSGSVLTFLPEYKVMLRDLTATCKEIDKMIAMQTKIKESIEELIKKHEEYNSIYEAWYIHNENKVVDLDTFKQGKFNGDQKNNRDS